MTDPHPGNVALEKIKADPHNRTYVAVLLHPSPRMKEHGRRTMGNTDIAHETWAQMMSVADPIRMQSVIEYVESLERENRRLRCFDDHELHREGIEI